MKHSNSATQDSNSAVELVVVPVESIGLDLSDRTATYVVVDREGKVVKQDKVALTKKGLKRVFGKRKPARIALEVGTNSPWVDRLLRDWGHEVYVANPRQLSLITRSINKHDRADAETLARLVRADPQLLKPIVHRGLQAQLDLALLRSRDSLVKARTGLINHIKGTCKSIGERLPDCSADAFARSMRQHIPQLLEQALLPLLDTIEHLTAQIKEITKQAERIARERYGREVAALRQVTGVGLITSLGYVLTLEDPARFSDRRMIGAYLGLTTRQRQSGESEPQLHITKAGDPFLRRLLVQSAHYILGPFGPDCQLRRWGLKLAGEGKNKIRKRKAVIAVARKLAVLLHRLWSTGEVYDPFHTPEVRPRRAA